jgi:hypothetical protein
MGTEWGGYHLHPLFASLHLFPLCATLMSLTILMGDAQFASVSVERTSVVRRSYFSLGGISMSPLVCSDVVTLLTLSLVTMLQKGPFHLEQRVYGFVLPGL